MLELAADVRVNRVLARIDERVTLNPVGGERGATEKANRRVNLGGLAPVLCAHCPHPGKHWADTFSTRFMAEN